MKRWLIFGVKIALAVSIIAYLLWSTFQTDAEVYKQLQREEKNWLRLGLAGLVLLSATLFTFFRWYLLVRVLEIRFTLREAIRLGYMGYVVNFFALGVVGGDIFKAFLLARDHAGRRTEAVMSVLVDRLVGLYGLLLLAAVGLVIWKGYFAEAHQATESLYLLLILSIGGFLLATLGFCFPRQLARGRVAMRVSTIPRVGKYLEQIIVALARYSQHRRTLLVATLITLGTQLLTVIGFWLIATGLPGEGPNFAQLFVMVPLALFATAVPLPMGGLGALEATLASLYRLFGFSSALGLLVSLAYRLVTILVAVGGIPVFLSKPLVGESKDFSEGTSG
ncbi:MAG: lysylphosphatidylglycerol synthase transmembrane domain-containing protein [Planctomycetota bacterium]|nr:lysylphosphatidylglycerol synthase transmembrane domain-containing protein [Planctomycetota bacterium]